MAAHRSTGPRSARRRDPGRPGPPRSPRALPEAVVAFAALALVLLAAAWARWAFLGYPFFADDYLFLDQMRDGALFHAQAGPDPLRNYWRPLSRQAYFGVVTLLGASPVVAHVLNLALFAGLLALVALVATGSEAARRAETFAIKPDPWGTQSHLSRFYFDRSMRWITRYLEDLRRQRPTLPPKSTLFFAGIPAFASWQSGDGALVRWVYSDATIRSYFFADFSPERARRGPTFFFTARRDSLVESAGRAQGLQQVAAGQMLTEHHGTALDAITLALEESPADPGLLYWRAWLRFATGDRSRLEAELAAAGCEPDTGPAPEAAEADRRLEAGDVNGAIPLLVEGIRRHALDPRLHALLGDVSLRVAPRSSGTAMEALVARLLAPGDPRAWRRWAQAQVETEHLAPARDCAFRPS